MEPVHHLTFGPFRLEGPHGRLWRGEHHCIAPIFACYWQKATAGQGNRKPDSRFWLRR
jgi:hypothetical protein